jgi:hypothetical protein
MVTFGKHWPTSELDVGRVIKTKKNTVALRTAKNKHE